MAREAHAEAARRNQEGGGEKPSSFPSLSGPKKAVLYFLEKEIKDLAWQAKEILIEIKIDPSIFRISKKNRFHETFY